MTATIHRLPVRPLPVPDPDPVAMAKDRLSRAHRAWVADPCAETLAARRRIHVEVLTLVGCSLLHLALEGDHDAIVPLLIERGARPDLPDRRRNTPLHLAAQKKDDALLAKLLVAQRSTHAISINATNYEGRTPLHLAALAGNRKGAALLLTRGANPFLPDDSGKNAIELAAGAGHADLAETLKKAKPPATRRFPDSDAGDVIRRRHPVFIHPDEDSGPVRHDPFH